MPHTSKHSALLFQPLGWLNMALKRCILIHYVKVFLENVSLWPGRINKVNKCAVMQFYKHHERLIIGPRIKGKHTFNKLKQMAMSFKASTNYVSLSLQYVLEYIMQINVSVMENGDHRGSCKALNPARSLSTSLSRLTQYPATGRQPVRRTLLPAPHFPLLPHGLSSPRQTAIRLDFLKGDYHLDSVSKNSTTVSLSPGDPSLSQRR